MKNLSILFLKLITFIIINLFSFTAFAGSGIFESYVIVDVNGGGNTYYDLFATTVNADFQGTSFGPFTCGNSLIIRGGQNKTYKNGTDDILNGYIHYRVYKNGTDPNLATWVSIQLGGVADLGGGDQSWSSTSGTSNILRNPLTGNSLPDGTYTIEVYTTADFTYSGSVGTQTHYQNVGGANYKATFTIDNPISITSPPASSSICSGSNVTLSATATGADTYYWQEETSTGVWSSISGASGSMSLAGGTVSTTISNITTTRKFRCQFTNCGGVNQLNSNVATITVQRPTISVQPVDAIDCIDNVVNFYVGATNVDYQWQRKRATDADYVDLNDLVVTDVSGTTTNYLRIDKAGSANNLDGTLYRCKITDKTSPFCTNTTNAVSLFVNAFSVNTVTTSPVCLNGSITFASNIASGSARLQGYQWYKRNISTGTISGANSASYSTTIAATADNLWGVQGTFQSNKTTSLGVTTSQTCVTSKNSSITVRDLPTVPTVTNAARCSSGTVNLSASGAGSGQNYKWYADNNTATAFFQKDLATYNPTLSATTDYYVSIYATSSPFCESARVKVTGTVNPLPTITLGSVADICNAVTTFALPFSATTNSPDQYSISTGSPTLISAINNATLGSSPISVTIPANASANTYQFSISVTNSTTTCSSTPQNFTVKINDTPTAPTVTSPINYCQNASTIALSATTTGSNSLLWYGTNSTGGTSSASAPTPSSSTLGTTSYYVSQKNIENCESTRASIDVIINENPTAPTTSTTVNYCKDATATALSATASGSNSLIWYDANDNILASAPTPSTSTVGTQTFKVSQKTPSPANCEGPKAIITINVFDNPVAPTVTTPVGYCQNATASALAATATGSNTLLWYGTNATGGTSSNSTPTPLTTSAGTTSYYVSQKDANNCESPRAKIDVEVTPALSGNITGVNALCLTGVLNNVTTLTANPSGGNGTFAYQWQNLAGNITSANNQTYEVTNAFQTSNSDTYKVTITSGYCTTTANMTVTKQGWNDVPSVTGNTPDICASGSKTLSIVSPNGSGTYKWFVDATTLVHTATGTSFPTPILTSSTTYYVAREQQVTASLTCQTVRTAVAINVISAPPTPTIINSAEQTFFCNNSSDFTLSVSCSSGSGQYRLNSGTWIVGNSVAISPITYPTNVTFTYDFKCVVSATCESGIASTEIIIAPTPTAPTISGNTNICTGGSTTLTASGCAGIVVWNTEDSGNTLDVTEAGTYNAICLNDDCESASSNVLTVVINAIPAKPTIISDDVDNTICSGGNVKLSVSACAGSVIWSNGTTATFINVSSSGTYSATCTENGCVSPASDVQTITVDAAPAAPTVTSDDADNIVCAGTNVVLSASNCAGSIIWSNGTTATSITVSASGTYNARCSVNNCLSSPSSVQTIVVNAFPIFSPQPTSQTNCKGANSSFTGSVNISSTLQWEYRKTPSEAFGSVGSSSTGITLALSATNIGSATYPHGSEFRLKATSNGCVTYSDVVTLSVNSVTGDIPDQIKCNGSSTSFDLTSLAISGTISSYQWEVSTSASGTYSVVSGSQFSGITTNILTINPVGSNDGTKYYRCKMVFTNTASGSCTITSNSGKLTVTTITPPTVSGASAICSGTSTTLTASGCTGTVTWNTGASGSTLSASSAGTYSATCTQSGCTSLASNVHNLTVNSIPSAPTITSNDADNIVCQGTNVVLTASNCAGTVIWSNAASGSTITVSSSGTYNATCTVNTCVSAASALQTVVVNPIPAAPSISGSTSICSGNSTTLTASGCAGTVIWNTGASGSTLSVSLAGTYNATCTENTCVSLPSSTQTITVNTIPDAPTISGNLTICQGESTTLTASGCAGTVVWNTGASGSSLIVSSAGTYNATCTVNSCTSPAAITQEIIVNSTPNAPTISSDDADNIVCAGTNVVLSASNCAGSVIWSNGTTATSITISASGTYSARCSVNNCLSVASSLQTIVVNTIPDAPTISSDDADNIVCAGTNVILSASNCAGSVIWSNGTTATSITISASGTYNARCSVNNCLSVASSLQTIVVNVIPSAPTVTSDDADNIVCAGTNVVLSASNCAGSIIWSNGTTATSITVSASGTYTARCSVNNCLSSPSSVQTIVVNAFPVFSTQSTSQTNCKGANSSFTGSVNISSALQWEYRKTPSEAFASVGSSSTATTLALSAINIGSATYPHGSEFRLKATSNGCVTYSDVVTLNVNSVTGDIPDQTKCNGSSTSFDLTSLVISGTISSYQWEVSTSASSGFGNVTGSQYSGMTTNILTINPISDDGTTKYYRCKMVFTNTASGSCTITSNSGKLTVTTITPPTVSGASAICSGTSTTLTASGCTGTVTWNTGTSGSTLSASTAGTYSATCTQSGCTSLASNVHTLTVNSIPSAPTIASNDADNIVCQGTNVVLTASNCAGTIIWSNGVTASTISVNTSGTYNATCTVNSCVSAVSALQTVVVNPIPAAPSISGSTSICSGNSTTLTASGCAGTVIWNTGASGSTLNVSAVGTYNATCTINNCVSLASATQTITVNTIPDAPTISGNTSFCTGTSTTLTASGCTGTITWNTSATGSTLSVSSAGTYNATCTVNSCISPVSANHIVSENPLPSITLGTINSICNAATTFDLPYTATTNAPNKYSLSATMPDFIAVSETDLTSSPISVAIPSGKTGNHTFSISLKNTTTGCINTQTFSITILPTLVGGSIETSPSSINCAGYTPASISSESLASGGKTDYIYQWQNSTDGSNFTDITGANQSGFTPTAALTQTTYFRRKVTDACGVEAFSSNNHQITIVPDPQITLTDASDKVICSGSSFTLDATVLGGSGTCSPTWQSSSSASTGFATEQSGGLSFSKSLTNTSTTPLVKYFRVIYSCAGTGSGNCNQSTSAVVKVTVNYIPDAPTLTPASVVICPTLSTTLTASGCTGTVTWAGGQTGSTLLVSTAGSYSATCTISSCVSVASSPSVVSVASGGTPVSPPTIAGTATICNGQSTPLTATGCTGLVTWSDGKTGTSISVNPSISTNYTATCNDGTCTSNASNEISVTVNNYPIISTQPKNDADCNGNSVSFSVVASPATGYQWQRKIPNGSFENILNATNNSLTISDVGSTTDPNQTQYQVIVSNASCSITSNPATLTVNSVTGSIADQAVCDGANVSFNLSTITTTGTIDSYQWQKRVGTSGTWNDIVGATTTTLTINNATNTDEQYYRCKFNFKVGSSTCARYTTEEDANGAKLTVLVATTPVISGTNAICLGKSTTLTANSCDGTISWSSGQTTATITVSPTTATSYTVTCASTQCSFSATSAPYSVAVNATPVPESITYDVIVPETLTFRIKPTVPNATIMWYTRATGGTGTTIAPPTFSNVGTYGYWATQIDPITGCESPRIPVFAKVLDYFHITFQPNTQADCKGNSVNLSVTAVGPVNYFVYQWQRKRPNEPDFVSLTQDGNGIKGWNQKVLTVSNVGSEDNPHLSQYRCIVNNEGHFLTSNPATISVNSVIGALPNLGTCVGTNYAINLVNYFTITGNVLSYQWQTRPGTSGAWTDVTDVGDISGSTTNELKFNNIGYDKAAYYRCLVKFNTQGFVCTEPTDATRLIVSGYPSSPEVSDISYCQFAKPAKLKVDKSVFDLTWYNQKTDIIGTSTAPTPNTDIVGTTSYFVAEHTDQGCESPRVEIKVKVEALPQAPINTTPSEVNEGQTLTFSADGTPKENQILRWYTSPTGTTFTTIAPIFTATGTYTRYVAQVSVAGCIGPRTAITARIIPNLKFTKQPITQADCDGNSVTFSVTATAPTAFTYQWQRQRPAEAIFTNIDNSITNSLKISNVGDAENPHLTKYRCIIKDEKGSVISEEVSLIVNEIKGTLANISLCDGKTAKLSFNSLTITGNMLTYQWQKKEGSSYVDIPTSQQGIANVSEVGTYRGRITFAIDSKTTCSRNTDDLKIDVKPVPVAPQVGNQAICQNTGFNLEKTITATNTLLWYDSAIDSTADKTTPKVDVNKIGKTTFLVSQTTQFGCESQRKTFDLVISAIPAKPIVSDVSYCRNAPSVALVASTETENQLLWYASQTAKDAFAKTPIPDTKTDGTTTYYVSAKNTANCESPRVAMKVSVAPCIATFENNFNNCVLISADSVKGNKWYDLYDAGGRLYASVNPNGLDLGKVSLSIRHYGRGSAAIPATKNDTKFMARYTDFQSSLLQNFEKPVSLRIYYENIELNEYKTATNLPNLTINDFNIVHYDGIREDCGFENNDNFVEGNSVVIYKNVIGSQVTKDFFFLQFDVNEFSENGATARFIDATLVANQTPDKTIKLNWQTKFEVKADKFILQRSADCTKWVSLGEIKATAVNGSYEQFDNQPLSGKSCYRLIYIDKDGTKKYLDPVEVTFTDTTPVCSVFPNPWTTGDVVKLYLRNIKEKEIKLYDLVGQQYSFDWKKDELGIIHLRPDSPLTKGTHFVVVVGEDGKRCIQKVVINP